MKVNTPLQIGTVLIKNRLTFAPTVKFDYTDDSGKATIRHVKHYKERAQGGCGMICVEATAVHPEGRFCKTHMGLWDDLQIEGHKEITKTCHEEGTAVIIQLNHTGMESNPECGPCMGPTTMEWKGRNSRAMSVGDIHRVQQLFTDAAIRAQKAGYDGIQLHGCHGYLINQFMSPITNQREDQYGGNIENRARFGKEIIEMIRSACGTDFLISVRISGAEKTVKEAILVAEEYIAAGCGYLQVSCGITPLNDIPHDPRAPYDDTTELGFAFYDHFKGRIPVSCTSGIRDPIVVRKLIEENRIDTVDLGRAILADPDFCHAVLEPNIPYVKCFDCRECQYGPYTKHVCPSEQIRKKNSIRRRTN